MQQTLEIQTVPDIRFTVGFTLIPSAVRQHKIFTLDFPEIKFSGEKKNAKNEEIVKCKIHWLSES